MALAAEFVSWPAPGFRPLAVSVVCREVRAYGAPHTRAAPDRFGLSVASVAMSLLDQLSSFFAACDTTCRKRGWRTKC
eukprot:2209066-Prymnesium_polylepis.1